ncbi:ABC transporter [Aspergillus ellipticus CBS 707.79]|uniref:ABC transporter n=1 Tax=Aspergillus ellipticus CBS 707.79 TaxID=1448320 RepID=A0A319EDG4_9EURO|nr:ABC transporter [Aspergillus ellipticus CBS 707.79]
MLQLAWRARPLRPLALRTAIRSVSSVAPPLISIKNGTFYQDYPTPDDAAQGRNPPIFSDFDFTLPSRSSLSKDGKITPQTWAVVGASGRTEILDILRGQYLCTPPMARTYPYLLSDEITKRDPRLRSTARAIEYVGFRGEGSGAIGGTRGAYLSARYESLREETDWTVRQYLKGQTSLNPLEEDQDGTIHDQSMLAQVIADLNLEELLDMPVANLSNGQTRRARIAKALLNKPELLLLDDPFMGLDPNTVQTLSNLLERIAAKADPRLIFSLRPQDPRPKWITHLMVIGYHKRILIQAPIEDANKELDIWGMIAGYRKPTAADPEQVHEAYEKSNSLIEAGYLDRRLIWDMGIALSQMRKPKNSYVPPAHTARGGEPLIEMDGVRVQYGDKCVLGDWTQNVSGKPKKGLHWKVRRGQRWAILGANGSGKTTLLSLITSDHPQAYALPVRLFGRSRLPSPGQPGLSIFELQSRIGHSSPEIHAFFPRQLTIRQALESAFADTFLTRPPLTHEQDLDVSAILRFFQAELDPDAKTNVLTRSTMPNVFPPLPNTLKVNQYYNPEHDIEYADTIRFGDLTTALQRLVLFLRALVHRPDIVILDEAFSGMPASLRERCHLFLDRGEYSTHRVNILDAPDHARFRGLTDRQALLVISHVREEIPRSVRYFMRLASHGDVPLDFRFGIIKPENTFEDLRVWRRAWAPPGNFETRSFRTERGHIDSDVVAKEDLKMYEWYSI